MKYRFEIINYLIQHFNYQSYLEVGTRNPADCFDRIKCQFKESIDPDPKGQVTYHLTSDEAFKVIKKNKQTFDIIFIDGLHLEEQVDRDVANSLEILNNNGTIVMHDCNPPNEFCQREQYEVNGTFPSWNGTVWKSLVKLRFQPNLEVMVVDTDWGCGIIRRGHQQIYAKELKPEYLTYQYLDQDRKNLLNLISVNEFVHKYTNH